MWGYVLLFFACLGAWVVVGIAADDEQLDILPGACVALAVTAMFAAWA